MTCVRLLVNWLYMYHDVFSQCGSRKIFVAVSYAKKKLIQMMVVLQNKKMKGETLKYSIVNRKTLTGDEADLHELANLAGIVMDPNVFKWVFWF